MDAVSNVSIHGLDNKNEEVRRGLLDFFCQCQKSGSKSH